MLRKEVPPDFGNWLAGFIDGEGCFHIHKVRRGAYYSCRFTLKVRDDDIKVMKDVVRITGIGYLRLDRARPVGANPCVIWTIISKKECRALVRLLKQYPLRAKKKRDFDIWKEAVDYWSSMKRATRWTGVGDYSELAKYKSEIDEVRRYKEGVK